MGRSGRFSTLRDVPAQPESHGPGREKSEMSCRCQWDWQGPALLGMRGKAEHKGGNCCNAHQPYEMWLWKARCARQQSAWWGAEGPAGVRNAAPGARGRAACLRGASPRPSCSRTSRGAQQLLCWAICSAACALQLGRRLFIPTCSLSDFTHSHWKTFSSCLIHYITHPHHLGPTATMTVGVWQPSDCLSPFR